MVRKDLRIYQAFTVTELQAQHKLKINTQFQLSVGRLNMEGVPPQRGHLQRRGEFFFSFFLLLLFSSFFHSQMIVLLISYLDDTGKAPSQMQLCRWTILKQLFFHAGKKKRRNWVLIPDLLRSVYFLMLRIRKLTKT